MKKAAFLDRDGTIIYHVHYLSTLSDCRLLPGIVDLLQRLQQAGYLLVVVTNQSGIAQGFFDESFVEQTHTYLAELLAAHGIKIAAFYYCPHHPTKAIRPELLHRCVCRKPLPGMLHQAAQDLNIDLAASLMIGDTARDVEAGLAASCRAYYIEAALAGDIPDI